jgi:NADH-quinone oxidoreductase subunit L
MDLVWLIPALPVLGVVTLVVFGRRLGDPKAGILATLMVAGSFLVTAKVYLDLLALPAEERSFTQTLWVWLPSGSFHVDFGFLFDPLSALMCLFVTGVGALIHLYAIGYMKGDANYSKFFLYLNLFIASMLLLVLGDNLIMTFLGWEGVGACSYLLISFWFTDRANASAGKKAFVTNRIGDFGFMVGTFLVWVTVGSVNYQEIGRAAGAVVGVTATAIALLFFLAATGKSAQLPLFVWLPDAMAGPTPVSALIHAATMVTSGVYLLTRLSPIMENAGWANDLIAWVGAITALLAAGAAVAQNDIKKVLAYSTISQLGFMFIAIGSHNYVGATFHMVTHAFFKALLFLGAGSVILAMAHEQDMRRYGNLRKYLPITFVTFMVGWLAISGIPPFSGFWSKDEILAGAYNKGWDGPELWAVGIIAAVLTAFYMTRLVIMTFFGGTEHWRTAEPELEPELVTTDGEVLAGAGAGGHGHGADGADDHAHHELTPDHTPHESPPTMTIPLVVLAALALLGGLLNLPFARRVENLDRWLEPVLSGQEELPGALALWSLAILATCGAVFGLFMAYRVYQQHKLDPAKLEKPVLAHAWYIDDAYAAAVGGPGEAAFQGIADFDQAIVDGAVREVGSGTKGLADRLRPLQTGLVRSYALGVAIGAGLLLAFVVTRMNL